MGNYYQVTKTPSGGYWVSKSDAVGGAITEGAALGVAAVGVALVATWRAVGRHLRDDAWTAVERAADSRNWSQLYNLSVQFVQKHPEEQGGYQALAQAMLELNVPTPQILDLADRWRAHGGQEPDIAALRASAFLAADDMASVLREGNVLVSHQGESKVLGHLMRAKALMWLGDLDEALVNAGAAVSLMPEASCYGVRAEVRWANGELAKAVDDFTRAVRLGQDDPTWLEKRASVYAATGDLAASEADRKTAADIRDKWVAAAAQAAAPTRCQSCGHDNAGSATTSCSNCGAILGWGSPGRQTIPAGGVATSAFAKGACPHCGYTNTPPGKTSCYNCGRRFGSAMESRPRSQ